MTQRESSPGTEVPRQRAVLAGALLREHRDRDEEPLVELGRLAKTAGAQVVGEVFQRRDRPDAKFYVGKGKAHEIADVVRATDADVVLFDNDLSPSQERNLAQLIGCEVVDRSRLILDIFATHARTGQARLQVELAQLQYMRSRLKRMWSHLERERLEGRIGTRGPGETQIETDRRLIGQRIQFLRRSLDEVERQQETRSASRSDFFRVSLVGYTNAGKSTLLRALTGTETLIEDQLFATLDTQTRAWELPGNQRVFLSDTVGFIRDLPHNLVASFHSTLAEVVHADLLLHVVDASNRDAEHQMRVVDEVLEEIGAGSVRQLLVFNKIDAVEDPLLAASLVDRHPGSVVISARAGIGVDALSARVLEIVQERMQELEVQVAPSNGKLLAYISQYTTVLEKVFRDGRMHVRMRGAPKHIAYVRGALGLDVRSEW